jgi:hypothetical protein
MNTYLTTTGFGWADWLISSVKKNPEGLLLLAGGCALLLRAGGSKTDDRSNRYQGYSAGPQAGLAGEPGMRMERQGQSQMSEGIARAADSAREYASNAGKMVSETTGRYASAAGEYADGARRTIVDQSQRMTRLTQSTVERVVREQPWAVAIAGLATGAAVAAAFPATRMERETLGVAGKGLSEAANAAGERLSEAASVAGERLMDVAEQKGLNTQGLKDVARDVAGTFGKSFGGDRQDESGNASKQNTALSGGGSSQSGDSSTHAATAGGSDRAVGSTYGSGPGFGPKNPSR